MPSCPPTRMKTGRSGPSKCAFASMTLIAECSASELGAFPVASKNRRAEPAAKALVADRPGLAMSVDLQIRVAGAIRCMKKLGVCYQADQNVGLLRRAIRLVAALVCEGLVELGNPAASLLELRPQSLKGGADRYS